MDSPASTATLTAESIDDNFPLKIDLDSNKEAEQDDSDNFILPDKYTRPSGKEGLSPLMLAASDPDSRILRAILSKGNPFYVLETPAERNHRLRFHIPTSFPVATPQFWPNSFTENGEGDVGITTPLMEAIRAQSSENVRILLDAKANPNGPPLHLMEKYSAFFFRFRPIIPPTSDQYGDVASRQALLDRMDLPQLSTLTWEEVEDRFYDGMAPFWCEQDFVPADFYPHGEAMPAIVEAARCGSIEVVDQLLNAGADTSFWKSPQFFVPAAPTESSLSVSSPLHAALQARDLDILKHLLDLGFEPNTMPLSNPSRCFTPLMGTVIQHEDFDYEAFDILARCPNINFEIRTPIYRVHILHFAVATLNLSMLEHIIRHTPLRNAGVTSLGHTLLHIACMPANSLEVQRHSETVYKSIHETRDLHAQNDPHASQPPERAHYRYSRTNFEHQTAVVKFLWEHGAADVHEQDVHGNTALHYLSGYREANIALLDWWRLQPGVNTIFRECNNMYEASAADLLHDSRRAMELEISGWKPWFKRTRKEERVARKQAIWKDLLGGEAKRKL
ncbi:ankyrin [Acephala macrosclerotiorum]|nr:ankyrin [Acephala macrosclerotiorum]